MKLWRRFRAWLVHSGSFLVGVRTPSAWVHVRAVAVEYRGRRVRITLASGEVWRAASPEVVVMGAEESPFRLGD